MPAGWKMLNSISDDRIVEIRWIKGDKYNGKEYEYDKSGDAGAGAGCS